MSDGKRSRSSRIFSQFSSPDVSLIVLIEPEERIFTRTFTWTLTTESLFVTCDFFSGSFTVRMESGVRYEFTLLPNGSGGVRVVTTESFFRDCIYWYSKKVALRINDSPPLTIF